MSTIKELAETCGVSEQAIRKWCARNQVSKDIAKHYIIDRATETAILRHYGKDEGNQVAKPTTTSCETCETSCETNETMKEIIEMLRKDLEAKDKQIESLQNSLDRTTAALVSAQESIKAAQLLQANSEQKLKMIENQLKKLKDLEENTGGSVGGIEKQKSIKINFDTLPEKKRVMKITLFLSPATT